ncbi:coiled-coil domain-containing protein 152 isoform X3 [Oryzias latipes]|nr:coiled-coil domain-containing protein 152 isoform X3 [Oryzias latipes]
MGLTKEKSLSEEKDGLLVTIRRLQETLQEQCNLREENDRLKTDVLHLKEHIERTREVGEAELQRLVSKLQADGRRRKVELEAVRLGCSREVEDARRDAVMRLDAKEAEMKKLLQEKDLNVEEMKKKLKDQEKQRQSELLKLQMEFGAKLARVQSSAERSLQQQQQGSGPLPHSIFKRVSAAHPSPRVACLLMQKLQFFQEEKNKEITALRQRIRELEENQRVCSLKRRKP